MQVNKATVYTAILDLSPDEEKTLRSLLDDFEHERTLLNRTRTGEFACYTGLLSFLRERGLTIDVQDDLTVPRIPVRDIVVDPDCLETRTLRDYQVSATRKSVSFGRGIVQAPTGSGKTEMAAAAICHMRTYADVKRVLYLVPTGFLMEQTAKKLRSWGIENVCEVGYGKQYEPGADVYVCIVDSAYRLLNSESTDIEDVELIILDEAHHASSKMWTQLCEEIKAPYRLAYTATVHENPECYSYSDLVLIGLVGPIIFEIRSKELRERGYLADPIVTMLKTKSGAVPVWSWDEVYKTGIVNNKVRNSIITSLAQSCYDGGFKVMVFVGRKAHGHALCEYLASQNCDCVFIQGQRTAHEYKPSGVILRHKWSVDDIAEYVNSRERMILVTTQVLDEGLDVPVINVLIMATGMKKYRRTVQRAGRGMRPKNGTNKVYIFDFWDENHLFLKRQSEYRMMTYREEEFDIAESIHETAAGMGIPIAIQRHSFGGSKR